MEALRMLLGRRRGRASEVRRSRGGAPPTEESPKHTPPSHSTLAPFCACCAQATWAAVGAAEGAAAGLRRT